jgi:hypothetical protein
MTTVGRVCWQPQHDGSLVPLVAAVTAVPLTGLLCETFHNGLLGSSEMGGGEIGRIRASPIGLLLRLPTAQ